MKQDGFKAHMPSVLLKRMKSEHKLLKNDYSY